MTKIHIIAFGVLIGLCGLLMWKVDSQSNKIERLTQHLAMANDTIKKHEENRRITENATNKYLGHIAILNDDIKRLRKKPVRCLTVTGPAIVRDGQRQGPKHDSSNGVRSDWLYDYSAKAERLRIERNACKDFVNDVWQSHKK